jgi:hypothetical protein
MERRQLLQDLAALGIAISPVAQALDAIRVSVGRTFESDDRQQLDHWEGITVEYGYSYLVQSPQQLITDLATALVTLRVITKQLDREAPIYKEWCRIGSALSGLMAKTLSNLGHTRGARHWWQTAQTASDSSGDLDTRLWIRGERLIHGLYEQRSPHLLLRQATDALELAKGHNCAGLLSISLGRAQTLVLAGIPDAAEAELGRTAHIFEHLPSAVTSDVHSVFGWGPDRLHYTETWVHAHIGNVTKADQAAARATACYPTTDYRTPTQIKLLQAFARTQDGDVTGGIAQAQITFAVLPQAHRTAMVVDLANRILAPIPAEQRGQASVTAYRELLAVAAPQAQKSISS